MGGTSRTTTTTRLDDGLRGWFKFLAGVVILVNLGVCFVIPSLWVDKEDSAERTINFTALAWLTMSGFGLIKFSELLGHDNKVLAKQKRLEEENENYRLAAEEQRYQAYIDVAYQPIQYQQLPAQQSQYVQFPQQPQPVMEQMQSPPQVVSPQSNILDQLNNNEPSTDEGQLIINLLSKHKNSTVIAGSPGCGKSTFVKAMLTRAIEQNPNYEFYVCSYKNDSFLGLREAGRVIVCETAEDIFQVVEAVEAEMKPRLNLEEEDRDQCTPLRLLLDDYPALLNKFAKKAKAGEKSLDDFKSLISDIVLLGRGVNVGLWVSTHNLNVESLGLDGKDIRGALNIAALGLISTDSEGLEQGNYEMIKNSLGRADFFSSEEIAEFKARLPEMMEYSEAHTIPLILAKGGAKSTLAYLPHRKGFPDIFPPSEPPPLEPSGEPQEGHPKSAIAMKIDLEKSEELSPKLTPEAEKIVRYLQRKFEETGENQIRLSALMKSNIIRDFDWDDEFPEEARSLKTAYIISLKVAETEGYLEVVEDEKGIIIKIS